MWVGLLSQVIQWMKESGQPHLLSSLSKDVRTCEEQLSQLETHDEAIEVILHQTI